MDFKSVSEFLDLVKNPDKYAAAVKELEFKQAELKRVSEGLGDLSKAAEIRSLAEKTLELARNQAEQIKAEQAKAEAASKAVLDAEFAKAQEANQKAADLYQKAKEMLAKAEKLNAEALGKEKDCAKKMADLAANETVLREKQKELEERLAKLRSVMI
jgi:hypothetical protein